MCQCQQCMEWMEASSGFVASYSCMNVKHCSCCVQNKGCILCNHSLITKPSKIHAHVIRYAPILNDDDNEWIFILK